MKKEHKDFFKSVAQLSLRFLDSEFEQEYWEYISLKEENTVRRGYFMLVLPYILCSSLWILVVSVLSQVGGRRQTD